MREGRRSVREERREWREERGKGGEESGSERRVVERLHFYSKHMSTAPYV